MTILNRIRRLTEAGWVDAPGVVPATGAAFPIGFLINPGLYAYNGLNFDITAEGLYTIMSWGLTGAPYANSGYSLAYSSNVLELMRGIMFQTIYGRNDEAMSVSAALNQIRIRKLGMRCGPTDANVVAPILAAKGVPHRTVHLLTAEPSNGFDDGHVACEVQIGGQWKFFDVPTKIRVEHCGAVQNIYQIIKAGLANLTSVTMSPASSYPETWSGTLFPTGVEFDQQWLFDADAKAWRNRIYQLPGIDAADGLTYFYMPEGTESRQSWLLSLSPSYRVLSEPDWVAKFY